MQIPSHAGWPLIGNVVPFLRDLFYYPLKLQAQYGPIFRMNIPSYDPIFVFDPVAIGHILEKNHTNYVKSADYDTLKLTLGFGLLTNEGASWKTMRKELQPYFFETAMSTFLSIMDSHAAHLTSQWAATQSPIVINSALKTTTLQIASETFFGTQLSNFSIDIPQLVDQLNDLGSKKMRFPRNKIPYAVPTYLHLKLKSLIRQLDTEVYTLMDAKSDTPNLLSLLVSNPKLTPDQVRDEIVTFLIAGYETTANTMMFTLGLLAQHPDIQQNLIDEIRATPLSAPTYKKWKHQFPLLYACINESMRLYPPAWMIGRRSLEADSLNGYDLPKNSTTIIDLFALHRLPTYWADPERFNPYRFLDHPPDKYTYLPFGGGPRVCIGQQFAMLEIVTICHHLFSQLSLKPAGPTFKLNPMVTLTPSPIELTLNPH